jgi:hypothetical protein
MTATPTSRRSRTPLIGAVVAGVVVIGVVIAVILLLTRDDSSTTVPPLTVAEQQAGVLRVTYPDRSLPDEPTVTTIGGKRIALYLDNVESASSGPQAVLRVGVGDAPPTTVTLTEGQTTTVKSFDVTLVAAYDSGDGSTEAADVTVAIP